ncbi:MAG: hypothetical protein WDN30_02935 [Pararobbsia sp.]
MEGEGEGEGEDNGNGNGNGKDNGEGKGEGEGKGKGGPTAAALPAARRPPDALRRSHQRAARSRSARP